jgi:ribosomal protein L37E
MNCSQGGEHEFDPMHDRCGKCGAPMSPPIELQSKEPGIFEEVGKLFSALGFFSCTNCKADGMTIVIACKCGWRKMMCAVCAYPEDEKEKGSPRVINPIRENPRDIFLKHARKCKQAKKAADAWSGQ